MYSDSFLHGAHSDTGMIYVQGHRGARGVLPENTLQGIEYALSLGVQSIEMDVLATRDDIIVVTHNTSLHPDTTRTMSGEWVDADTFRVRDLTLKQLQDFNVGACRSGSGYKKRFADQRNLDFAAIPALTDVFELLVQPRYDLAWLNIEVKSDPINPEKTAPIKVLVQQLIDDIRAFRLERRVAVQSFDWNVCLEMQRLAPQMTTSYLSSVGPEDQYGSNNIYPDSPWMGPLANAHLESSLPEIIAKAGGKMWAPYFGNLTKTDMGLARSLGLITYVWTVNELADIDRMTALGVHGVISDYPLKVLEYLYSQGLAASFLPQE